MQLTLQRRATRGYHAQMLIGAAVSFVHNGEGSMRSWAIPSSSPTLPALLAEEFMVWSPLCIALLLAHWSRLAYQVYLALPAHCKLLVLNAEPFRVSDLLWTSASLMGQHGAGMFWDVDQVTD